MIEIYDRADFKDKFASLMAADINLMHAGIDPKSDTMSTVIDAFLDQFKASTPARAPEPAPKTPAGYIITDLWDDRTPAAFIGNLYETKEIAQGAINQTYSVQDRENIEVTPVYL